MEVAQPRSGEGARPLRVLHVIEATDGGTARHVRDICLALRAAGADVFLACAIRRSVLFRHDILRLGRQGVFVTEIDMRRSIAPLHDAQAARRLAELIGRVVPDVMHLHSSKAGGVGRLASIFAPVPVVYTPHAYAFLDGTWRPSRLLYLAAEWCLARLTDHVAAVSESERLVTITRGLAPSERVTVVANGVAALPDPSQRRAGDGCLRLGWLGRLARQKHPEAMLRAAIALRRRGVDFALAMGGDGDAREACEAIVREHGLGDRIRLLGRVEDTNAFYKDIDVLCMSSRFEGLPYAALDAMAWALPIIAFDAPGVRDLVVHEETGLLARQGDVAALAATIERLASDAWTRARYGAAGRARVAACFRFDRQIQELLALYNALGRC